MSRQARCSRKTAETNIVISIDLDGSGKAEIKTGIGFFDHMLKLFAKHSIINLRKIG